VQNVNLNKVKSLDSNSLFVIIVIVVMLATLDSFSYLSRIEEMSKRFLISLTHAYSIFIFFAIPSLIVIHGRNTEESLLKAFLIGFIPFVVFAVFHVTLSAFSNISFSHRLYPDLYLSQLRYYISWGLPIGLMNASIQMYKKLDKLLGSLIFVVSVSLWLLLYLLPLISSILAYGF